MNNFGTEPGFDPKPFGETEASLRCCLGELEIYFAVILGPATVGTTSLSYSKGTVTVFARTVCIMSIPCEGTGSSDAGPGRNPTTCAEHAGRWDAQPPGEGCNSPDESNKLFMCTLKNYKPLGCCKLGCPTQVNSITYTDVEGTVPLGDSYQSIREQIRARFGFGGSEYDGGDPVFDECCTE
tara:strand:- start:64 stop:609 length:546 start_codon:yes stop_codon:yes gene_type:complete